MRLLVLPLLLLVALSPAVTAQGTGAAPQGQVSAAGTSNALKIGDGLYAYISDNDASSNATFLVSARGVVVVDTGFDEHEATRLLAAIRAVSAAPIRYLINTHYHRDHQAGNGAVGPVAEIISTAFTRERTMRLSGRDVPYRPATIVVDGRAVLHLGDSTVELWYPGPAHTSGDLLVYFPRQKAMVMGDLFLTRSSPAMDTGSVGNWIRVLEQVLAGPAQIFVPGHFELARRDELQRFHDYLADLRDQVATLKRSGASLESVRREIKMDKYADFRQYPQFRATFADNAEVLYREIDSGR